MKVNGLGDTLKSHNAMGLARTPPPVPTFAVLQAVRVASAPSCPVVLVLGGSFSLLSAIGEPSQHCARGLWVVPVWPTAV